VAFAVALCICSLSYALAHVSPLEYRELVTSPLLPGVALYSAANGSLLFGSGFGNLGNVMLIVCGSTLTWVSLFAAFRYGFRRCFNK
jgi:hypothetical protein